MGKNTKVLKVDEVETPYLSNSNVVDRGPLKLSKITFYVSGSLTDLERITGISICLVDLALIPLTKKLGGCGGSSRFGILDPIANIS